MKKWNNKNDAEILLQMKQVILNQLSNVSSKEFASKNQLTQVHMILNFYNGISSLSSFTQIYFTVVKNGIYNRVPEEIHIDRFLSEKVISDLIQYFVNDYRKICKIQNSKQEITFSIPWYYTSGNGKAFDCQICLFLDFYGCLTAEELMAQYLENTVLKNELAFPQTEGFQKIK